VKFMPRKETYWKNPEKYRDQSKQYSKNNYVPRKKKKALNNTFGNKKTISRKSKIKTNSDVIDLDITKLHLEKYYSSGYASKKLKQMRELGQVVTFEKYPFMPLSIYEDTYHNRPVPITKNSHWIGEQGTQRLINNYIRTWFPSPRFMIYLNPVDQRGVDFLITEDGDPYAVLELTNYQKKGFFHSGEILRYIKSLNYWTKYYPNIYKVIIVNYPENLKNNPKWKNAYTEFVKNKIGIKIMR
jgi:hypothetical protein